MPAHPRIVAVDPGNRRVGLAVSDPLGLFAQPLGTFSPDEAVERLRQFHAEHGIARLLVGWPLTLDGEEGEAVERVRPYFNRLRNAFPGVPVEPWDERFSSQRAAELLVNAGVRRKARAEKGRLDQAAAAVLLQEYLDEQS